MEKVKSKKEHSTDQGNGFNIKKLLGEKKTDPNEDINKKLLKAAKILERMVNQNTYNDIALGMEGSFSLVQDNHLKWSFLVKGRVVFLFCFILLTHVGSHREVYWEF